MPLPLIPIAIAAVSGVIAGTFFGGDKNDAQVIVNTPSSEIDIKTVALLGGTAIAAVLILPRVLDK